MKPAASLSASLLAKKGSAAPTKGLEPKGFISDIVEGTKTSAQRPAVAEAALTAPQSRALDVPRFVAQPAAVDSEFDAEAGNETPEARPGRRSKVARRPVGSGKRIAMTLRLDHDQHLKLRLFSTHLRKSSQQVMLEALERYFSDAAPTSVNNAFTNLRG